MGRFAMVSVLGVLAGCAGRSSPPRSAPPADLVVEGGTIHVGTTTVARIGIRGGETVATGDEVQALIGSETRRVDLAGGTLVPGLVDGAVDLLALGQRMAAVDLVATPSADEAAQRVRAALGSSGWILGRGWDHQDWRPARTPDRELLDAISPQRPIVLENQDGTLLWVNSAALRAAEIDERTPAPPGGRLHRDRKGRLTGILEGTAARLVMDRMPAPTGTELDRRLRRAVTACAAAGLVEVHDLGASAATVEGLRRIDRASDLPVRVVAYYDGRALALSELLEEGPYSGDRLHVVGVHFPLDGPLADRAARLRAGYADGLRPEWAMDPTLAQARAQTATERGFQVSLETHGDEALARALDILSGLSPSSPPRIHGPRLAGEQDLARILQQGVRLSVLPSRTTREYSELRSWLGDRAERVDPWRTWMTRGATLALASRAPAEDPAAVLTVLAASTRQDLFGEPKGGFVPSERLSRGEALRIFARGYRVARIDPRPRSADWTAFDRDPFTADDLRLATSQVRFTLVNGTLGYALPEVRTTVTSTGGG